MSKRAPIVIAGEAFASKAALITRCQHILWSYRPGEKLIPSDLAFMSELLRHHPEADDKIGHGIEFMFIMPDQWGRQCFAVRQVDGREIDFSFKSCITKKPPDADFRQACRSAIKGQILGAKKVAFAATTTLMCPVTGDRVVYHDCHVDHEPPETFKAILDAHFGDGERPFRSIVIAEIGGAS